MKALSGQITVTTAGTAVQLSNRDDTVTLMIKALDTNSGIVAVGNDGDNDVTVNNGLRLAAKEFVIYSLVNMSSVYVDSAVNGDGICWTILEE